MRQIKQTAILQRIWSIREGSLSIISSMSRFSISDRDLDENASIEFLIERRITGIERRIWLESKLG
jgi:hypothetical protein